MPNVTKKIKDLKELDRNHTEKKMKGSILRTKLPGIEEGEFNLAYLSKLEKMKAEQNLIYSLVNSEGQLVNSTEEVLKVTYDFYKNLYSKEPEDHDAQRDLLDGVDKQLSDEDRLKLDADFSKEEFERAIKDLKKNKSPGTDGLTKEFYDFFWDLLQDFYLDCIKEIEQEGELTESQKQGLVRISYKKNGRVCIENYRPITLLNVDLKILTRTLAKRIAEVLPKLIHEN